MHRCGSYPGWMPVRPRTTALLVVGAATASGALVLGAGKGLPEWLFGAALLTFVLLVTHRGVVGVLEARAASAQAAALSAVDVGEAARRAVAAERERLSGDITRRLRELVSAVAAEVAAAREAADPGPGLARIHRLAQEASAELRRQLGLLRRPAEDDPVGSGGGKAGFPRRVRADVAVAAATGVLAAVEAVVHPRAEGLAWSWGSVLLTALTAVTVVAARAAAAAGACAAGALYVAGAVVGAPVTGGLWCLVTVGGLLWSVTAAGARLSDGAAAAVLVAGSVTATGWRDADNVAVLVGLELVAIAAGLVTGRARRRAETSARAADDRRRSLAAATSAAVVAERGSFAREVHDVVSHTVGVVAVQAAAGQVSWPDRPDVARRTLDVIGDAAAGALAELERLEVRRPARRTEHDVTALVDRIRAGGTRVRCVLPARLPASCVDVVYRVVQECLTNVVRHARGAAATVEVEAAGSAVRVVVSDDGPGAGEAGRGYGLVGLGERVAFVGGTLTYGPPPAGRGFRVTVVLPVAAEPVPERVP